MCRFCGGDFCNKCISKLNVLLRLLLLLIALSRNASSILVTHSRYADYSYNWGISNQLNLVSPDLIQCVSIFLQSQLFSTKCFCSLSFFSSLNTQFCIKCTLCRLSRERERASSWEHRFYVSSPKINCLISGKVTFLNVSSEFAHWASTPAVRRLSVAKCFSIRHVFSLVLLLSCARQCKMRWGL